MSVSRKILSALCACATAVLAVAQDQRAEFAPMFNPSGDPAFAPFYHLEGGAPPLLGAGLDLHLAAPGSSFASVLVAFGATAGLPLPVGPEDLLLYVDPATIITDVPVPIGPSGGGQLALPIPPDPQLVGLDLAWQGVVMSQSGIPGGTNLLASNFGILPGVGLANFAFPFTAVIREHSYLTDGARRPQPMAIYCNAGTATVQVTITGTKSPGAGPLEIRDGTGATAKTLASVPANSSIVSVTVTVPPGGKLYFYNADPRNRVNGLKWQISVS